MSSKTISRLTTYTTLSTISSSEHNAEHQQYIDNFNEIFQSFDYSGGVHYPKGNLVKFPTLTTLDLESFLTVAHNSDGTIQGDKIYHANWGSLNLADFLAVAHNSDGTIKSDGISDPLIYAHNNDTGAHPDIRNLINNHTHVWTDIDKAGSKLSDIGDVPDYTGNAGKIPAVNSTEDGVEFIENEGGKVKTDSGDPTAGYLSDKIDTNTLEIDTVNHLLKIKSGLYAETDLSNVADADFLAKMLANDGSGSGLDADLLRGLPADFTSSLWYSAGYQKLPSGFIIQWGVKSSSSGDLTITFPIAFPNYCVYASAVAYANGTGNSYVSHVRFKSTTSITFYTGLASTGQAVSVSCLWLAIGY